MRFLFCFVLIILSFFTSFSQLVEYPIGTHQSSSKNLLNSRNIDGRAQASALTLPFWDDFSTPDAQNPNYARRDLWSSFKTVFLNNGIGINPPTKNVVTFDGVDTLGNPYSVTNILAKGFADSLVSQPIQLATSVDPSLRNTVYLSFFYQIKGNGESPDPGDLLNVYFLNVSGRWELMQSLEVADSLDQSLFYQVIIPVTDDRFYHDAFQFKFQNFARLSGPYDTWSVDYVYLNKNRSATDTSYPDRSISTSLTSMFNDYFSIPVKHFLENPSANLKKPSLNLYNLKTDNLQPVDYTTQATISTTVGTQSPATTTIPLDSKQDPGSLLFGGKYLNVTLNKIPTVSAFDPAADSISVIFKFGLETSDNKVPADNGDYDPAHYSPIDFRTNDTIQSKYTLSSYYAYDDGVAEYGAGLNQTGAYVACKFLYKSSHPDTLVYVDIYFPQFGDNTSQSIQLEVRSDLSDSPLSILFRQSVLVERTTQNKFVRYLLQPNGAPVSGDFYVGWKQLASVSIPAGLDKNTDNGDKLYYNTNGSWIQNVTVHGSMMIRPGIGKPQIGVTVGLENEPVVTPIYPNPTKKVCYLPAGAESATVFDITGRQIESELDSQTDRKALTILSPVSGIVIVRYFLNGKIRTEKVMVQAD